VLGKLKQKDGKSEASLGYILRLWTEEKEEGKGEERRRKKEEEEKEEEEN
jgi:hypothetical protein